MSRSKKCSICRLNNYMHIKELLTDKSSVCRSLWGQSLWVLDTDSICRLKNYLQTKELSADQRNVCRLTSYLQIKKVFNLLTDRRIICRLKNYLQLKKYVQIKVRSADWRTVCRSNLDLQIILLWSAYCKNTFSQLKKYLQVLICKSRNYLQIK